MKPQVVPSNGTIDDKIDLNWFLNRIDWKHDDCWSWTGIINPDGYGRFNWQGRSGYAHRASYELFGGPIPEGLVIDHVCHNDAEWCTGGSTCLHRRCVNPAHLQMVTSAENTRRGLEAGERTGARQVRQLAAALTQGWPRG